MILFSAKFLEIGLYSFIIVIFLVLLLVLIIRHSKMGNIKGVLKDPMLLFVFGFLFLMANALVKKSFTGDLWNIISFILVVCSIVLNAIFIGIMAKQLSRKKKS